MRKDSINEEKLIDYVETRLPHKEAVRVGKHLAECEMCLEEVMILRDLVRCDLLETLDLVPEQVTRRAINAVNAVRETESDSFFDRLSGCWSLLESKFSTLAYTCSAWQRPALAPVRGVKTVICEDLIRLKKSFAELSVVIEIEKKGLKLASVEVSLAEYRHREKAFRVTLFRDSREVSSYLLNGSNAVFDGVPFGRYSLVFTFQGEKKGVYPFEIKESRNG